MSARTLTEAPTLADVSGLKLQARGLSRVHAALYVGVSPSKFDEMVTDGRMPKPKCVDARRIWDKRRLDEAFEALPDTDAAEKPNPYRDVAV